jgi:hypothetical protein
MQKKEYIALVQKELQSKAKHNKSSLEKIAASFGIKDQNLVKELTELAIVNEARRLAHLPGTRESRFESIVELYHSQVNLSHRTSQSMLLQQYSTPAPIGYLAGIYTKADELNRDGSAFEPSAGNGLLTIAANPMVFVVNELDETRRNNLKVQGFDAVMGHDATMDFSRINESFSGKGFSGSQWPSKGFNAVISNPPFGSMDFAIEFDGSPIKVLDHLMCIRALNCLRDDGRAALIIGGHTTWDEKGRVTAGKNRIFYSYLYKNYYIDDIINIDGHKLYSKQGTAFNVRLILISGRREKGEQPSFPPLYNPAHDKTVFEFSELFNRVSSFLKSGHDPLLLELEAEAIELELQLLNYSK